MIVPFGKFYGQEMDSLPDDYLIWLASGGRYYKSKHSTELKWKVPEPIFAEARKILEKRGYRLKGERWEK